MEYLELKNVDFKENLGKAVLVKGMCSSVRFSEQKDGKLYATVELVQGSSKIEAKVFGIARAEDFKMTTGKVYGCRVNVNEYPPNSGKPSCAIYNYDELEDDAGNYVPVCDGYVESWNRIVKTLNAFDGDYARIARYLIGKYADKFKVNSAATSMHHAGIGGLVVHTCEVMELCHRIATYAMENMGLSNDIDMELLTCAAALHDIGKIVEIETNELGVSKYSAESSFQSHITIGVKMIYEAVYMLNMMNESPERWADIKRKVDYLTHCVYAHHGKLEWGSPVRAALPEADILFRADEISASLHRFSKFLKDTEEGESTTFTSHGEKLNYLKKVSNKQ